MSNISKKPNLRRVQDVHNPGSKVDCSDSWVFVDVSKVTKTVLTPTKSEFASGREPVHKRIRTLVEVKSDKDVFYNKHKLILSKI